MQDLELFQYWRSSCSWRVRWALEIKGISYKKHSVNLLKSEQKENSYSMLNPSLALPTLKIDGVPFGESFAILEWLEETHPTPPLLPQSPIDRLKVRQLAQTIVSGTQPLQNLKVLNHYAKNQQEKMQIAHHWISEGLAVFEKIARECSGTYSFGSHLTLADLCLVPQCYNALRFTVNLSQFPTIERIFGTCMKRKDCINAAPESQPDAV